MEIYKILADIQAVINRPLGKIITVLGVFILLYISQYVPYINILLGPFNPLLAASLGGWIVLHSIASVHLDLSMKVAIVVILICFPLLLLGQGVLIEVGGAFSFFLVLSAVLKEISNIKKAGFSFHDNR